MITLHGCGKAGYMVYRATQSLNMDGFIELPTSATPIYSAMQTKIVSNSPNDDLYLACRKVQDKMYPVTDSFLKS